MKKLILALTAFLFMGVTNLYATPIVSVVNNSVSGSDMAGMLVTVGSETIEWLPGSGDLGQAQGTGWNLKFDGSSTWFSNDLDDLATDPSVKDRTAYWEFNTQSPVSSVNNVVIR